MHGSFILGYKLSGAANLYANVYSLLQLGLGVDRQLSIKRFIEQILKTSNKQFNYNTAKMSTDNTEVEIETMQLQLPEEEHQTISQDEEAAPKLKHDASPEKQKFFVLPLSRVKHMMKIDPDGCDIFSNDSVVLVTKATVSSLILVATFECCYVSNFFYRSCFWPTSVSRLLKKHLLQNVKL